MELHRHGSLRLERLDRHRRSNQQVELLGICVDGTVQSKDTSINLAKLSHGQLLAELAELPSLGQGALNLPIIRLREIRREIGALLPLSHTPTIKGSFPGHISRKDRTGHNLNGNRILIIFCSYLYTILILANTVVRIKMS